MTDIISGFLFGLGIMGASVACMFVAFGYVEARDEWRRRKHEKRAQERTWEDQRAARDVALTQWDAAVTKVGEVHDPDLGKRTAFSKTPEGQKHATDAVRKKIKEAKK